MELNVTRKALLGAGAALFGAMGLFGACASDDGGSTETEVISAINILDNAGLHDIDESINEEQEVPPDARTVVLKLQTVVELTEWPSDLEDQAEALAETFAEFAGVLEGDNTDMARAGELSTQAHVEQHDFSHDVWAWLQEEAGIETASQGDHGS